MKTPVHARWWLPLPEDGVVRTYVAGNSDVVVRAVAADRVIGLRRLVLREGRDDLRADLDDDGDDTTVHLAVLHKDRADENHVPQPGTHVGDDVLACLTIRAVCAVIDGQDRALNLALMAVHPHWQRRGLGALLIRHAQVAVSRAGLGLWANARDSALGFYQRLDFTVSGDGFIGPMKLPHHQVYWTVSEPAGT